MCHRGVSFALPFLRRAPDLSLGKFAICRKSWQAIPSLSILADSRCSLRIARAFGLKIPNVSPVSSKRECHAEREAIWNLVLQDFEENGAG